MNFGHSDEQDETSIELTPLIDVVFLLLIFFMISTTFTKETSLKINLPESTGETVAEFQSQQQLLLIIRADRKAPHEAVIRVMDVAQELGLTNVTFATKQFAE